MVHSLRKSLVCIQRRALEAFGELANLLYELVLLWDDHLGGDRWRASSNIGGEIEISQFPDSFPALAVAAAAAPATTRFTGTRRLRIKESDRVAAMADVLARLGVESDAGENSFAVRGTASLFNGGDFSSYGDHRIAMATAIAATRAAAPVEIDDTACAAKSYPGFFAQFAALGRIG